MRKKMSWVRETGQRDGASQRCVTQLFQEASSISIYANDQPRLKLVRTRYEKVWLAHFKLLDGCERCNNKMALDGYAYLETLPSHCHMTPDTETDFLVSIQSFKKEKGRGLGKNYKSVSSFQNLVPPPFTPCTSNFRFHFTVFRFYFKSRSA